MSLKFNTPQTGLNTTSRAYQNMTSGGGSCNLTEISVEYTENGEYNVEAPEGFDGLSSVNVTVDVKGSGPTPFDGHFDEAGLREIGWDDNDIAYFEEANQHFAEDDELYVVSEMNKEAYRLVESGTPLSDLSIQHKRSLRFFPKFTNLKWGYAYDNGMASLTWCNYDNEGITIGVPVMPVSDRLSTAFMYGNMRSIPVFTEETLVGSDTFHNCTRLTDVKFTYVPKANEDGMYSAFANCKSLISIPPIDYSEVTNMQYTFDGCDSLQKIDFGPAGTPKCRAFERIFQNDNRLRIVRNIDFSSFTNSTNQYMFYGKERGLLTEFKVNGKINVSIGGTNNLDKLTAIDYDSVKSILEAANRTDNTNAKTLALKRTMADPNGELAALVASCSTKGWTITGLTLN